MRNSGWTSTDAIAATDSNAVPIPDAVAHELACSDALPTEDRPPTILVPTKLPNPAAGRAIGTLGLPDFTSDHEPDDPDETIHDVPADEFDAQLHAGLEEEFGTDDDAWDNGPPSESDEEEDADADVEGLALSDLIPQTNPQPLIAPPSAAMPPITASSTVGSRPSTRVGPSSQPSSSTSATRFVVCDEDDGEYGPPAPSTPQIATDALQDSTSTSTSPEASANRSALQEAHRTNGPPTTQASPEEVSSELWNQFASANDQSSLPLSHDLPTETNPVPVITEPHPLPPTTFTAPPHRERPGRTGLSKWFSNRHARQRNGVVPTPPTPSNSNSSPRVTSDSNLNPPERDHAHPLTPTTTTSSPSARLASSATRGRRAWKARRVRMAAIVCSGTLSVALIARSLLDSTAGSGAIPIDSSAEAPPPPQPASSLPILALRSQPAPTVDPATSSPTTIDHFNESLTPATRPDPTKSNPPSRNKSTNQNAFLFDPRGLLLGESDLRRDDPPVEPIPRLDDGARLDSAENPEPKTNSTALVSNTPSTSRELLFPLMESASVPSDSLPSIDSSAETNPADSNTTSTSTESDSPHNPPAPSTETTDSSEPSVSPGNPPDVSESSPNPTSTESANDALPSNKPSASSSPQSSPEELDSLPAPTNTPPALEPPSGTTQPPARIESDDQTSTHTENQPQSQSQDDVANEPSLTAPREEDLVAPPLDRDSVAPPATELLEPLPAPDSVLPPPLETLQSVSQHQAPPTKDVQNKDMTPPAQPSPVAPVQATIPTPDNPIGDSRITATPNANASTPILEERTAPNAEPSDSVPDQSSASDMSPDALDFPELPTIEPPSQADPQTPESPEMQPQPGGSADAEVDAEADSVPELEKPSEVPPTSNDQPTAARESHSLEPIPAPDESTSSTAPQKVQPPLTANRSGNPANPQSSPNTTATTETIASPTAPALAEVDEEPIRPTITAPGSSHLNVESRPKTASDSDAMNKAAEEAARAPILPPVTSTKVPTPPPSSHLLEETPAPDPSLELDPATEPPRSKIIIPPPLNPAGDSAEDSASKPQPAPGLGLDLDPSVTLPPREANVAVPDRAHSKPNHPNPFKVEAPAPIVPFKTDSNSRPLPFPKDNAGDLDHRIASPGSAPNAPTTGTPNAPTISQPETKAANDVPSLDTFSNQATSRDSALERSDELETVLPTVSARSGGRIVALTEPPPHAENSEALKQPQAATLDPAPAERLGGANPAASADDDGVIILPNLTHRQSNGTGPSNFERSPRGSSASVSDPVVSVARASDPNPRPEPPDPFETAPTPAAPTPAPAPIVNPKPTNPATPSAQPGSSPSALEPPPASTENAATPATPRVQSNDDEVILLPNAPSLASRAGSTPSEEIERGTIPAAAAASERPGSPIAVSPSPSIGSDTLSNDPFAESQRPNRSNMANMDRWTEVAPDTGSNSDPDADLATIPFDDRDAPIKEPLLHVVKRGENFWTISKTYYGTARYYQALWAANRSTVPQIDELVVGKTIRIPPVEWLDRRYISPILAGSAQDQDTPKKRTSGSWDEATPANPRPPARRVNDNSNSFDRSTTESSNVVDTEAEEQPTSEGLFYRVRPYDTLKRLARDYLGDSRRASEILELNRDRIADPLHLEPGTRLRMPADARPRPRR